MPNSFKCKNHRSKHFRICKALGFLKAMEPFAKAAVSKSGGWTFAKNKAELMVMNEALT